MSVTELSAHSLSRAIHARQISCREVMQAYLQRVDAINPRYQALVSLQDPGSLLKDLANTSGIATTLGSPLMRNFVPQQDGLMVQRMKAAGCIIVGKSNTPEFGLGSHTFNEVFGVTRNAYDATRSAGGSSGGAAVALALHLLPVADGSDFMGSLRNPAGWNNVFGLRPSQGRVPMWPATDVWVSQLGTEGPMARTVQDVAQLLAVQSGFDARAPLSLAGYLPMESGILGVCEQGLCRLESLGCAVQPLRLGTAPNAVWQAWLVWRRALVASRIAPFLLNPKNRELIKPEALWEFDQAAQLTGTDFLRASVQRTAFYQHLLTLFETHDFLALPVSQVWPFDATQRWPSQIMGVTMDTYHRWMEVVIYATFAGLPCISVPVGFDERGLPMGMQLIGKPRGDFELLQLAHAYEQAAQDVLSRRPATQVP